MTSNKSYKFRPNLNYTDEVKLNSEVSFVYNQLPERSKLLPDGASPNRDQRCRNQGTIVWLPWVLSHWKGIKMMNLGFSYVDFGSAYPNSNQFSGVKQYLLIETLIWNNSLKARSPTSTVMTYHREPTE